jgi:hypothetical protein
MKVEGVTGSGYGGPVMCEYNAPVDTVLEEHICVMLGTDLPEVTFIQCTLLPFCLSFSLPMSFPSVRL